MYEVMQEFPMVEGQCYNISTNGADGVLTGVVYRGSAALKGKTGCVFERENGSRIFVNISYIVSVEEVNNALSA